VERLEAKHAAEAIEAEARRRLFRLLVNLVTAACRRAANGASLPAPADSAASGGASGGPGPGGPTAAAAAHGGGFRPVILLAHGHALMDGPSWALLELLRAIAGGRRLGDPAHFEPSTGAPRAGAKPLSWASGSKKGAQTIEEFATEYAVPCPDFPGPLVVLVTRPLAGRDAPAEYEALMAEALGAGTVVKMEPLDAQDGAEFLRHALAARLDEILFSCGPGSGDSVLSARSDAGPSVMSAGADFPLSPARTSIPGADPAAGVAVSSGLRDLVGECCRGRPPLVLELVDDLVRQRALVLTRPLDPAPTGSQAKPPGTALGTAPLDTPLDTEAPVPVVGDGGAGVSEPPVRVTVGVAAWVNRETLPLGRDLKIRALGEFHDALDGAPHDWVLVCRVASAFRRDFTLEMLRRLLLTQPGLSHLAGLAAHDGAEEGPGRGGSRKSDYLGLVLKDLEGPHGVLRRSSQKVLGQKPEWMTKHPTATDVPPGEEQLECFRFTSPLVARSLRGTLLHSQLELIASACQQSFFPEAGGGPSEGGNNSGGFNLAHALGPEVLALLPDGSGPQRPGAPRFDLLSASPLAASPLARRRRSSVSFSRESIRRLSSGGDMRRLSSLDLSGDLSLDLSGDLSGDSLRRLSSSNSK